MLKAIDIIASVPAFACCCLILLKLYAYVPELPAMSDDEILRAVQRLLRQMRRPPRQGMTLENFHSSGLG